MEYPTYRKILLAVDGGKASGCAVKEALALATLSDASVHAVFVVHPWGIAPYSGYLDPEALGRVLNEDGQHALMAVREQMSRLKVRGAVEICGSEGKSDSIAACLLRCAARELADLIVIGTHGRSGVSRVALGSVAEAVLREATCPVLVVRPRFH